MNHTISTTRPSIGRDFMTFGNEALAVHRADERRFTDVEQARLHTGLRASARPSTTRRLLGTSMIWLGSAIAGKAARMPEREVPMPEQGLAPTR